MVKMADSSLDKNQQKILDKKLDKCRNPENNPDSEMWVLQIDTFIHFFFAFILLLYSYKKRIQAMLDEDDDSYHVISAQNNSMDSSALNMSIPVSPEVA